MFCEKDCAHCGKIAITWPQYTSTLPTRLVIVASLLILSQHYTDGKKIAKIGKMKINKL